MISLGRIQSLKLRDFLSVFFLFLLQDSFEDIYFCSRISAFAYVLLFLLHLSKTCAIFPCFLFFNGGLEGNDSKILKSFKTHEIVANSSMQNVYILELQFNLIPYLCKSTFKSFQTKQLLIIIVYTTWGYLFKLPFYKEIKSIQNYIKDFFIPIFCGKYSNLNTIEFVLTRVF